MPDLVNRWEDVLYRDERGSPKTKLVRTVPDSLADRTFTGPEQDAIHLCVDENLRILKDPASEPAQLRLARLKLGFLVCGKAIDVARTKTDAVISRCVAWATESSCRAGPTIQLEANFDGQEADNTQPQEDEEMGGLAHCETTVSA